MATPMATALSNTTGAMPMALPTRVGKIRTMRSFMPMAVWRRARSRCARCRAMFTPPSARLREKFEAAFWCEELSTYGLALDRNKQLCRVVASNAGHALWAGIAAPGRARPGADTLLGASCFSGWGVRTVAVSTARYNPMSYHNGSVWPHDNAMIALGLARYGFKDEVLKIFSGLFDA